MCHRYLRKYFLSHSCKTQAELVSTHLSFPSCVHKNVRQLSGSHKAIIFYLLRNTAAVILKQNQTLGNLEKRIKKVCLFSLVLMVSIIKFPQIMFQIVTLLRSDLLYVGNIVNILAARIKIR